MLIAHNVMQAKVEDGEKQRRARQQTTSIRACSLQLRLSTNADGSTYIFYRFTIIDLQAL